jgi:hypothetical protein
MDVVVTIKGRMRVKPGPLTTRGLRERKTLILETCKLGVFVTGF